MVAFAKSCALIAEKKRINTKKTRINFDTTKNELLGYNQELGLILLIGVHQFRMDSKYIPNSYTSDNLELYTEIQR